MIQGIVVITAKPGQRAAILEVFKDNESAVRAEEGCIEYAAFIDVPGYGPPQTPFGGDTFVIVEKSASVAALKAHAAVPHMARIRGQSEGPYSQP